MGGCYWLPHIVRCIVSCLLWLSIDMMWTHLLLYYYAQVLDRSSIHGVSCLGLYGEMTKHEECLGFGELMQGVGHLEWLAILGGQQSYLGLARSWMIIFLTPEGWWILGLMFIVPGGNICVVWVLLVMVLVWRPVVY